MGDQGGSKERVLETSQEWINRMPWHTTIGTENRASCGEAV